MFDGAGPVVSRIGVFGPACAQSDTPPGLVARTRMYPATLVVQSDGLTSSALAAHVVPLVDVSTS